MVYKNATGQLGPDYFRANKPIVQRQLVAAGYRLAIILEGLFGDDPLKQPKASVVGSK
jgi:hypothetical protein